MPIISKMVGDRDSVTIRDLRIVFSFESNLESNRLSDSFSNRIFESNRPYTTLSTQAVTQLSGPAVKAAVRGVGSFTHKNEQSSLLIIR